MERIKSLAGSFSTEYDFTKEVKSIVKEYEIKRKDWLKKHLSPPFK